MEGVDEVGVTLDPKRLLEHLSVTELHQILADSKDRLVLCGIRDLLKDIAFEVRTIRRLMERTDPLK